MARKAKAVPETPFMNVKDAARVTGLSECNLRKQLKEGNLRKQLKEGNIPHIMSGRCIRINVPALLRQMDAVK